MVPLYTKGEGRNEKVCENWVDNLICIPCFQNIEYSVIEASIVVTLYIAWITLYNYGRFVY